MAQDAVSSSTKIKPGMSGVTETMLLTIAARAADAASAQSLIHDRWAKDVLDQIEYEPPALSEMFTRVVVLRARLLDAWATEFLDANPDATVLQLGCGLDSRVLRLSPSRRVRWIDVDLPQVVELRQKLIAVPPGDYTLLSSSVLEREWLDKIPADRPVLVIMEGLVAYLQPADVESLFQRLCGRFPRGEIIFDAVGKVQQQLQSWNRPIYETGAKFYTAIDDPQQLVKVHPALRVRSFLLLWQFPGMELSPRVLPVLAWLSSWVPGLKTFYSAHRYEFGDMCHSPSSKD